MMMVVTTPDTLNGIFETGGGILQWISVRKLMRDKCIKGMYWPTTLFFALWGLWNLFYFPNIHQLMSFIGSLVIVTGNIAWVVYAIKYRNT